MVADAGAVGVGGFSVVGVLTRQANRERGQRANDGTNLVALATSGADQFLAGQADSVFYIIGIAHLSDHLACILLWVCCGRGNRHCPSPAGINNPRAGYTTASRRVESMASRPRPNYWAAWDQRAPADATGAAATRWDAREAETARQLKWIGQATSGLALLMLVVLAVWLMPPPYGAGAPGSRSAGDRIPTPQVAAAQLHLDHGRSSPRGESEHARAPLKAFTE